MGNRDMSKSLQQDPDFTLDSTSSRKPNKISQNELSDLILQNELRGLVCDLKLLKNIVEMFASMFQL